MDLSLFVTRYECFCRLRDAACDAMGTQRRRGDEDDATFYLRVATWMQPHRGTGDAQDSAAGAAQRAGALLLGAVVDDVGFLEDNAGYFLSRGYSELAGVYAFTAPLEAQQWAHEKRPKYDDVAFASWGEVHALHALANEGRLGGFMRMYKRVMLTDLTSDPFPSAFMARVFADIANAAALPASLTASTCW